jgi:hypothetical protein
VLYERRDQERLVARLPVHLNLLQLTHDLPLLLPAILNIMMALILRLVYLPSVVDDGRGTRRLELVLGRYALRENWLHLLGEVPLLLLQTGGGSVYQIGRLLLGLMLILLLGNTAGS